MIDCHTHTEFSFDGRATAVDMAEKGASLNLTYMAFTDHCDRDYAKLYKYLTVRQMNVEKYINAVSKMKEKYPFLALGIELGYSKEAERDYKAIDLSNFDCVLNSVHTVNGLDCYNKEYFVGKTKQEAFSEYLNKIYESLDADYSFDIITHIGFVRKNAPYGDRTITMSEFGDVLDAIFKKIIDKNKTLEINCNICTKDFMPTKELVERYYYLGGRNISFASDAHVTNRVAEMYLDAAELVKSVGFNYWTVYRERRENKIKID